jgi:hypothetical protein
MGGKQTACVTFPEAIALQWSRIGKRRVTGRSKPPINRCLTYCRTVSTQRNSQDFSHYPMDMPEECGILATPGEDLHPEPLS